jgi:hypothetical protein
VGGDRERLRRKKKIFLALGPIFQSGFAAAIPHTLSSPFSGPSGPDHYSLVALLPSGNIRSLFARQQIKSSEIPVVPRDY